jgi:hypothetical protein
VSVRFDRCVPLTVTRAGTPYIVDEIDMDDTVAGDESPPPPQAARVAAEMIVRAVARAARTVVKAWRQGFMLGDCTKTHILGETRVGNVK